ncbi:MAG: hypothetical protein CRN43_22140 [Candidatus Nephrothrix sp. EaCA]|nr:MAG: hypothetical protein CRN43_22140 [Candidatus Nephrothrix sp. EaCA]
MKNVNFPRICAEKDENPAVQGLGKIPRCNSPVKNPNSAARREIPRLTVGPILTSSRLILSS